MNRQRCKLISAVLTLIFSQTIAANQDSCFTDASMAVENKSFEQAEALLLTHLEHAQHDTAARFLLARVLSWQEKWAQSMVLHNSLLEQEPRNADYLLARANTLDWMGRSTEALLDLEQARELAPGYSALWRTQIALLVKINRQDQAIALLEEARQKFPAEDWNSLLKPVDAETDDGYHYAIEASIGHDELSNNRSAWESASFKWLVKTPEKHFAHLQLDTFQRFDLDDQQLGASYALPFADSWYFYAGFNYSPTHEVIANRTLESRVSKSFSDGLNLHAGISHARYTNTNSQQLILSAEYYWSDYRAAYTYRLIDVMNAGTGYNHNIQFNHYYTSVNFVGLSGAAGDDVEFDGTPSPPISNVVTLSVYGRHMFKPQWSLTYALTHHQQGDFYDRNGFVLGIKYDF